MTRLLPLAVLLGIVAVAALPSGGVAQSAPGVIGPTGERGPLTELHDMPVAMPMITDLRTFLAQRGYTPTPTPPGPPATPTPTPPGPTPTPGAASPWTFWVPGEWVTRGPDGMVWINGRPLQVCICPGPCYFVPYAAPTAAPGHFNPIPTLKRRTA